MPTIQLAPARFDTGWSAVAPESGPSPARLRIVTLNTWFAHTHRAVRLDAQLRAFEALDPHILALQEVTADLLKRLLAAPWFRARYAIPASPALPLATHGYGTVLAVRCPVQHFEWTPFDDSAMGRGLLTAQLTNGPRVATVHLESLAPYAHARATQLAAATAALTTSETALLMGDFNFDATEADAPSLVPWTDLWPIQHPHSPGFTVDSTTNAYRLPRGHVQRRIDHILLHNPARTWRLDHIDRIGTTPVAPHIHLSDHYGLMAELVRATGAA